MLDKAFDALKTYNWGADRKALDPIDEAIVATHGDVAATRGLETRLVAVLNADVSRDAKDFVCRKLRVIGTKASVPTLAGFLPHKHHSHMARYALERIPAPEAAEAMRDSLAKISDPLKVGVISSLGVRQDSASVPALASLLHKAEPSVARAAALALGDIRSEDAAAALTKAKPKNADVKFAATDASLACAEQLLEDGKKAKALVIYKGLAGNDQPKQVRLAATRGMLACAS